MTSIIQKLEVLSISENERAALIGYLTRTKKSKKYFRCKNDYVVIPNLIVYNCHIMYTYAHNLGIMDIIL